MNLVDSLKTDGYAQTTLAELFGTPYPANVQQLVDFANEFAESDKVKDAAIRFHRGENRGELKEFLCKYRDKRAQEGGQVIDDVVGKFGMSPQLHAPIVAATRHQMTYIMSDVWYVIPNGVSRMRAWSQNWHRDPESYYVLKVMVYFRNVDDESGPLEYVRGSHKGKYLDLVPARSYPNSDVDSRIDPALKLKFCVPAGTVLFVDTSGLHRGGYTRSRPRLSGVWTYVG